MLLLRSKLEKSYADARDFRSISKTLLNVTGHWFAKRVVPAQARHWQVHLDALVLWRLCWSFKPVPPLPAQHLTTLFGSTIADLCGKPLFRYFCCPFFNKGEWYTIGASC